MMICGLSKADAPFNCSSDSIWVYIGISGREVFKIVGKLFFLCTQRKKQTRNSELNHFAAP